jgi:hypothetical protein
MFFWYVPSSGPDVRHLATVSYMKINRSVSASIFSALAIGRQCLRTIKTTVHEYGRIRSNKLIIKRLIEEDEEEEAYMNAKGTIGQCRLSLLAIELSNRRQEDKSGDERSTNLQVRCSYYLDKLLGSISHHHTRKSIGCDLYIELHSCTRLFG